MFIQASIAALNMEMVFNLGKKKERDIFKKKLKQLERKLNEEEIQNMRFYTSRLGHLVMYGHEIQLLHVDSNCFL